MYTGSNAFKALLIKALENRDFAEILINKPSVALSENFSHVFAGMLKGEEFVVGGE